MKILVDFFPILLFFITFKLYDDPKQGILAATAVIIVATMVQVAITWLWKRRIEKLHLVTLALIVVFGGATLALENELYIKWKPTVVNWLFAAAFIASQYIGERNLVQRMMGAAVSLPAFVWRRLNVGWVVFFLTMGIVNLYVAYSFDTDTWVNFKLFGLMGLTLLFVIGQAVYLMRHMEPEDEAEERS